jgi:hypothetical protein
MGMTVATSVVYELWDTESGNLIADYDDEDAALRAVRAGVNDEGPASWETIELVRVEPGGMRTPLAQGTALVAHALAALNPDPEAIEAARVLIVTVGNPNFRRAMNGLRAALTQLLSETEADLDRVRAAVSNLSRAGGVPVGVYIEGHRISLVTPNKTMAALLAIGATNVPADRDVPVRVIADGYAVDIAA